MIDELELLNGRIKTISTIYDDLAEEVRQCRRNSLPNHNLPDSRNYTSFLNLYNLLHKLEIEDDRDIKLYIRSQYEILWTVPKFKGTIIPVNMMYSKYAPRRFVDFIEKKTEKIGRHKIDKYLDKFIDTALVRDDNSLSLREDVRVMYDYLTSIHNQEGVISRKDVIKGVILIEQGKLASTSKYSVCAAYLYLNQNIDVESPIIKKYFGDKITQI